LAPEYNLHIQAHIPVALSTIHNSICTHEPGKEAQLGSPDILTNDNSGEAPAVGIVEQEADVWRGDIAKLMWDDYLHFCAEWGINTNKEGEREDGEDEDEDEDEEEPNHSDKSNGD
jgi:hypothetical protein